MIAIILEFILSAAPMDNEPPCIAPINNNIADLGTNWAAVDSWTVHAWAKSDPESAWNFFPKTTLAAGAEAYHDLWYGIWSGPDTYSADASPNPGQAFTGALTPTCNFPVMNMNRHAGVLYDMITLAGIEPCGDTIVIDSLVPLDWFTLRLPLMGIAFTPKQHRGYYQPVAQGNFRFAVRAPSGLNPEEAKVFINGNPIAASVSSDGFSSSNSAASPVNAWNGKSGR